MGKQHASLLILPFCLITAAIAGPASAQVTYSLGTQTDALDAAFYAGEAIDGSDVAGRAVFNFAVNNAGTEGAFWAINVATFQQGLFKVKIGQPWTWERLTGDIGFNYDQIVYTPDDSKVIIGSSRRYTFATNTMEMSVEIAGYGADEGTITVKNSQNWYVSATEIDTPDNLELVYLPVLPNGTDDTSREPVIVTNFGFTTIPGVSGPLTQPWVSPSGDAVAFVRYDSSTAPDFGDVYLLKNVGAILAAPKIPGTDFSTLAPTTLTDPNIVDIRADETVNYATVPSFSQDGSLVFFAEDLNNQFDLEDFFGSLALSDFDLGIANRDGSGDVLFPQLGNQAILKPFPSGNRLTLGGDLHIYVSTLTTATDLGADSEPLPQGETQATIGGETVDLPFTLTDSAVQIMDDEVVNDASGTVIELPAEQVINFPAGTPNAELTVFTPIDPVTEAKLPPDNSFITEIPVQRSFGPPGTRFFPKIAITIAYLDAEISPEEEGTIVPFLYNEMTGVYDIQIAEEDIVERDPANNTITFLVDHFSTYALGITNPSALPAVRPLGIAAIAFVLLCFGVAALTYRRRGTFVK